MLHHVSQRADAPVRAVARPLWRRRWVRNLVVATVVLEMVGLGAWVLRPENADPDAYEFLLTQTSDQAAPVAYDPCGTIQYVVRTKGSPPGGQALIKDAVNDVAKATGLEFVYEGATDEAPVSRRPAVQPERYGNRWAPVVIGWVTPDENPKLAGDAAGEGGSTAQSMEGLPKIYVTGSIDLNAVKMRELLADPAGKARARAVILHELGHLVGLGHVKDKHQLMHAKMQTGVVDFSAGDKTGLAALGKGACVPELRKP